MEVTSFSVVLVFWLKRELCAHHTWVFCVWKRMPKLEEQRLCDSVENREFCCVLLTLQEEQKVFWLPSLRYLKKFAYFAVTQDLSVPSLQWENRWYNHFWNHSSLLVRGIEVSTLPFWFKNIILGLSITA